jgi:dolichol kinase
MEKSEIFRRSFHMTAAVYLIYFLMPDELVPGFYKWYGVLIILCSALIVEAFRLKTGKLFFGLREYEKKQISAFAWFTIGMSLALLFFKMEFVVPVVIGMALIDPLIGELRRRKNKLYPVLPALIYIIIMFTCLVLLSDFQVLIIALLSSAGTFTAIYAESWDIKYVDDDFLMLIVPLLLLTCLNYVFSFI